MYWRSNALTKNYVTALASCTQLKFEDLIGKVVLKGGGVVTHAVGCPAMARGGWGGSLVSMKSEVVRGIPQIPRPARSGELSSRTDFDGMRRWYAYEVERVGPSTECASCLIALFEDEGTVGLFCSSEGVLEDVLSGVLRCSRDQVRCCCDIVMSGFGVYERRPKNRRTVWCKLPLTLALTLTQSSTDLTTAWYGQMDAEPFFERPGHRVEWLSDHSQPRGTNTATGPSGTVVTPRGAVVLSAATPWHTGQLQYSVMELGVWVVRWITRRICLILVLLPILIWIAPAHPLHQGHGHKLFFTQCAPPHPAPAPALTLSLGLDPNPSPNPNLKTDPAVGAVHPG